MASFKVWLSAARPRTLPLSISGILVGGGLALKSDTFEWSVFSLAIVATLGFQILSNFANDYGDGLKGTDNADRVGPARALQSGLLSASQLKKAIIYTAIMTTIIVILLIYTAFGEGKFLMSLLFLFLGLAAILSAIKYTVGKSAYGYRGLGDLFVFVFFGLVGVCGSFFMFAEFLSIYQVLPAITIGTLSTMVLHLNNMRDRTADEKVGKNTLAVYLGKTGAVRYHTLLFISALLCWIVFLIVTAGSFIELLSLVAFIPLVIHMKKVYNTDAHTMLDPELKKVALATFLLSLIFFTGSLLFQHYIFPL